ncbi:hypothetical protein ACIA03_08530 [Nocardioides sp. NPDC051685]|uniref:hypothetical protein n=1 Tax=Nocardioides sp. NPDC051685 TaxID=3364334 RepID=UPI0037A6FC7A
MKELSSARSRLSPIRLVGSAVVSAAVGTLAVGGLSQPVSAATAPMTIVAPTNAIAAGAVVDRGTPVLGADVIVYAWPKDSVLDSLAKGESAPLHLLGYGQTTKGGTFAVSANPATIPTEVVDPSGRIDLEIRVADASRELGFSYTVEAPSGVKTSSSDSPTFTVAAAGPAADPADPAGATKPPAPNMRFDLGTGAAFDASNDPAKWVDHHGKRFGATRRAEAAGTTVSARSTQMDRVAAGGMSTMETCVTTAGAYIRDRPERFVNVYGWSGAKVKVTEISGSDHTLGVAVSKSSGWSSYGTSTKSFSAGSSWSNLTNRGVRNRVNYRDYTSSCSAWKYRRPVGYSDLLDSASPVIAHKYHSGYCTRKVAGQEWHTGSAKNRTFGTGVDVGPINVSAQSGYGSSQDLFFNFTSETRFCGSNPDGLLSSSSVEGHDHP